MSSRRSCLKRDRSGRYVTASRSLRGHESEETKLTGVPSPKRPRITSGNGERSQDDNAVVPLSYTALEIICQHISPEDGILELNDKSERFEALLKSSEIRTDLMKMVIQALHRCCSCRVVPQHADRVLRLVKNTNFLSVPLSRFINKLPHDPKLRDECEQTMLISKLLGVFLVLLQRFGSEVVHDIPLPQLNEAIAMLGRDKFQLEPGELVEKIKQVKALRDEVIGRANDRFKHDGGHESHLEPSTSFREISVIPKAADLSIGCKPFLRVNVTDRKYKNLELYLDTQFRLLREDYIFPLREGIKQLKKENESLDKISLRDKKPAKNVPVYHDVEVLYPVCSGKGMVYRIRFNALHPSVRGVRWDRTKRLRHGSLVCLSADGFYSPYFATVENRDKEELCLGELDVRFEDILPEEVNHLIETKEKLDMVESPSFFEAYRHVLEALKEFKPEDLPFQQHIVECRKFVGSPVYLRQHNGVYDMSVIMEEGTTFPSTGISLIQECNSDSSDSEWVPNNSSCNSNDSLWNSFSEGDSVSGERNSLSDYSDCDFAERGWVYSDSHLESDDGSVASNRPGFLNINFLKPYRESLGFNFSQMRAFQLALTKEFVVIQGPPGTGKTYVGLKIARVLLQNASLWQEEDKPSPILMVSYTNHALDQFLEGLLPMEGIVRVGGRSKSEKLKHYTLKVLRLLARDNKEIPRRITRAKQKVRKKIQKLVEDNCIDVCTTVLKSSRKGIIFFDVVKPFMLDSHVKWFERKGVRNSDDLLCQWLGVDRILPEKHSEKSGNNCLDHDEDFRMQFSVRNFVNEEDHEHEDRPSVTKVLVCKIEETKNPKRLRLNLQDGDNMCQDEEKCQHNLQYLSAQQRWRLYRLWLQKTEKHYLHKLQIIQPDYEKAIARSNELFLQEDLHILRNARVIGMTTTCAARYRHTLQTISPKIVLVEEAAEVSEAHIVTSLSKGCEQLIMIGDHQQLKPNPAVYKLAKKYKLDVSLFERMMNVGIDFERLSVQHRMRPEIAVLMKHIYEDLQNHESVQKYEDVKGMEKNMFFVNHSHLEDSCDQSHSHLNQHEASFLVALCRYLLQQGYRSRQITLLTTYAGQMFAIKEWMMTENEQVQNVRLTTVDNYQGEENDIILLSLVRSNKNEKVGFIETVNRACVALSRAKKGFYCIGNFSLLSKYSDIWNNIVADLKVSGSIGDALPLVCQIHGKKVFLETASDFSDKVPYGGCQRPCKVRLECGHVCRRLCHPNDTDHQEYKCIEPCIRTIKGCTHLCPNLCWETCMLLCRVQVKKTLSCGHTANVRCGRDLNTIECKARCDKILSSCGHRCQNKCGEPCSKSCKELVKRSDWPCGHEVTVACSATSTDCPVPCLATLECGHQCSGRCGECRMGRVHRRCKKRCGRVLVCSHVCNECCQLPCPPCSKKCENRCVHSKCDKSCSELCVPCGEKCSWECRHHKCNKLCGDFCNRPRCNIPCNKLLVCGPNHFCRGVCGELCICALCERNGNQPITEVFLGGEDEKDALFIQLPDCKHIFAISDLDRYMDMPQDETAGGHMIQLKSCPRCKTGIRRCQRYGNVIKQQLRDIEKVKMKFFELGNPYELNEKKTKLRSRLMALKTSGDQYDMVDWKKLERSVNRMSAGKMAALIENQVTLIERFCALSNKLKRYLFRNSWLELKPSILVEGRNIERELDYLRKRSLSNEVTQRELQDINTEFTRLSLNIELCLLEHDIHKLNLTLDSSSRDVMFEVKDELLSGKLIKENRLKNLLEDLAGIRGTYPILSPVTPEERREIVSAMDLSSGHWYKCPQGHIYAIGGCGGPMQRATCPECRAMIGGQSHVLEMENALASEMDGARYPSCKSVRIRE